MKLELKLALLAFVLAVVASLVLGYANRSNAMTYPITDVGDLRYALSGIEGATPLSVRDNHGNQMELAGVEPQVNDANEVVGFVLVVAQKGEKP